MEFENYQQEIQELRKANRILKKQLERSESDRIKLEETKQKKEFLLKNVIEELQESQKNLQERSHDLERTLINLQITRDKMSALGSLVADVAHEINNPVGFIAGNIIPAKDYISDLLRLIGLYQKFYTQPFPEIQELIDRIDLEYLCQDLPKLISSMEEGTKRIRDISNSLRTFSRADTGKKVLFNIHEGINSTLIILKHRLKGNQQRPPIQVLQEYGELPLLECFPSQLNQVFMNILANAIDALEESNFGRSFEAIEANPNQIKITTKFNAEPNCILINIQDNGLGMSDDIQQQVFDHLFTTKPVDKGTGLGLFIARQIIVDRHGGNLEVSSSLGKGTSFMITLPIKTEN